MLVDEAFFKSKSKVLSKSKIRTIAVTSSSRARDIVLLILNP